MITTPLGQLALLSQCVDRPSELLGCAIQPPVKNVGINNNVAAFTHVFNEGRFSNAGENPFGKWALTIMSHVFYLSVYRF